MKYAKPVAVLSLCTLIFGAGAVVGQQARPAMTDEDFDKVKWAYEDKANRDTSTALFKAYEEAPNNPEVVQTIMKNSLSETSSDRSLMLLQTAQNQKLIEQNARIIALLEAQQKGK